MKAKKIKVKPYAVSESCNVVFFFKDVILLLCLSEETNTVTFVFQKKKKGIINECIDNIMNVLSICRTKCPKQSKQRIRRVLFYFKIL